MNKSILVTGGRGFIGTNFIFHHLKSHDDTIINLDKLTYASTRVLEKNDRHIFVKGDIADEKLCQNLLFQFRPWAVVNFAAESHVDRSIHFPDDFLKTNILGTHKLLKSVFGYWKHLSSEKQEEFRFLHISTDEVYGSLAFGKPAFKESTPYRPNSPYSASKASSDHLVRAYTQTYGLPAIITNCSNNYGPYQFPEKLIPLTICNCLKGEKLPIYGDGLQIRDWLYVIDHCEALSLILKLGKVSENYNIGGDCQRTNLEIVHTICDILDELGPHPNGLSYCMQISHVKDRLGHDRRYAINNEKIKKELGWIPKENLNSGLEKTVNWYLNNSTWIKNVTGKDYKQWFELQCI